MRRRGVPARVQGPQLRELREDVRFTKVTYDKLAKKYGYETGMGVLKAAQRYERDHGIGEEDPSPPLAPEPEGAVHDPAVGTGDLSGALDALRAETEP